MCSSLMIFAFVISSFSRRPFVSNSFAFSCSSFRTSSTAHSRFVTTTATTKFANTNAPIAINAIRYKPPPAKFARPCVCGDKFLCFICPLLLFSDVKQNFQAMINLNAIFESNKNDNERTIDIILNIHVFEIVLKLQVPYL